MASILDRHAESVIERLSKGHTFQSVSDWLAELGIKIAKQSIHSWYSRKMRKIKARKIDLSTNNLAIATQINNERSVVSNDNLKPFINTSENNVQMMGYSSQSFITRSRNNTSEKSRSSTKLFTLMNERN